MTDAFAPLYVPTLDGIGLNLPAGRSGMGQSDEEAQAPPPWARQSDDPKETRQPLPFSMLLKSSKNKRKNGRRNLRNAHGLSPLSALQLPVHMNPHSSFLICMQTC